MILEITKKKKKEAMTIVYSIKVALISNPCPIISLTHFHFSRKNCHSRVHTKFGVGGDGRGRFVENKLITVGGEVPEKFFKCFLFPRLTNGSSHYDLLHCDKKSESGILPVSSLPEAKEVEPMDDEEEEVGNRVEVQQIIDRELNKKLKGVTTVVEQLIPPDGSIVISACVVGLLTGLGVVLFNYAVHEIRDFFWDGIPSRGASWLREEPLKETWQRVILVPVCGGMIVCALNSIRSTLETPSEGSISSNVKAALRPFFKSVAASVTLGTGNSLGPEGPSVEIGASIGKGVGHLFEKSDERRLSLVAAGSAAGISSGFNAAVAGCFFAVESVLWSSSADSSSSLANTTSTVILSAVIASVVSQVGLGSDPAFTVPEYDFLSASGTSLLQLPLLFDQLVIFNQTEPD